MKNLANKNIPAQFIKQCGAVLVMALLMLFVLTLIGVSSISTTTMEEKMSGNTRNRQLAFQSAESALRDAEKFIETAIITPNAQFTDTGIGGLYTLGNGPSSTQAVDPDWWNNNNTVSYNDTQQGIRTQPQYVIEFLGSSTQTAPTNINILGGGSGGGGGNAQSPINSYRITARGTGATDNAVVVLQTHYGKR